MDTEPVTAEIPNSAHILRFFDLTADQRTALQEKIHANAGRIRMFVHPHYEEYAAFMDMDEDADSARQLHEAENAFLRIISSDDPSLPPLLVILGALSSAEQQENEKILAEKAKNNIYVIPSKATNPTPMIVEEERLYSLYRPEGVSSEDLNAAWDLLRGELKTLGVKQIFMGGLEYYLLGDESGSDSVGGCVGKAVDELKQDFTIDMSRLTWPDREDRTIKYLPHQPEPAAT